MALVKAGIDVSLCCLHVMLSLVICSVMEMFMIDVLKIQL